MMSEESASKCIESSDDVKTSNNRLGSCLLCGEFARYSCPRCEIKTCSLACVKQHKDDTGCTGIRNKTAFKTLSEFTNLDLLSDYRMLEETTRSVEKYKRDRLRLRHKLPEHLYRLRNAVTSRGSSFLIMPAHSSRRRNNTTYYNWSNKKIQWRVEWIFPQAGYIKVVDERVLEEMPLSTLINKYLNPESCPMELQENLEFYQSAGLSGISLLLKAERIKRSSARFFELDPDLMLKNALKNKCIVEYPIIYVVLINHKDAFEIIDSDAEKDMDQSMYGKSRMNFNSNNQQRGTEKSTKNLLFNESDDSFSDDDFKAGKANKVMQNVEDGFHIPNYHDLIQQNV